MLTRIGWPLDPQEVLDRFLGCSDEYYRAQMEAHTGRQLDAAAVGRLDRDPGPSRPDHHRRRQPGDHH